LQEYCLQDALTNGNNPVWWVRGGELSARCHHPPFCHSVIASSHAVAQSWSLVRGGGRVMTVAMALRYLEDVALWLSELSISQSVTTSEHRVFWLTASSVPPCCLAACRSQVIIPPFLLRFLLSSQACLTPRRQGSLRLPLPPEGLWIARQASLSSPDPSTNPYSRLVISGTLRIISQQ